MGWSLSVRIRWLIPITFAAACSAPGSELTQPAGPDTMSCAARFCGDGCSGGTCDKQGVCVSTSVECSEAPFEDSDGWDDMPGSGNVYVFTTLAVAGQGVGFDIDDRCRGPGDCVDNSLFQFGQLGNDQVRQALLGGELLYLIEVAGLDDAVTDDSVTVKVYGGVDFDDPFFPANNFAAPVGESKCCEFTIDPRSLDAGGQARDRIPARVSHGWLTLVARGSIPIFPTIDPFTDPLAQTVRLERAKLAMQIDAREMTNGLMGGAFTVGNLARVDNPYCKTLNNLCQRALPDSSLLDLMASILQPDIDLDVPRDGLERFEGGPSGRVGLCFDGRGNSVPPLDAMKPETCALQPTMADGYSVGMTFSGVRAQVRTR